MYIKSFDGELITIFQLLTVDDFGDGKFHITNKDCMRIASYKTKERCIEVLKECYECLKYGNISYDFPKE